MIQFLAVVALTAVTSGAPCAVVSEDFTPAFVASEVVQDIAVEVAYPVVEQEFAARVSELGLTGAAPLFGTNPDATFTDDAVPARSVAAASRRAQVR